jgi:hypothetical protein
MIARRRLSPMAAWWHIPGLRALASSPDRA